MPNTSYVVHFDVSPDGKPRRAACGTQSRFGIDATILPISVTCERCRRSNAWQVAPIDPLAVAS